MTEDKKAEDKQQAELRQEPLSLRQELHPRSVGLHHHAPEDFHRSQWQSEFKSCGFLIYRWILATFFGSGLVSYLVIYYYRGHWFIYLTNWGFILCAVTSISAAIFATIFHKNPDKILNRSGLIKCYWAIYWINLILAHKIAFIYWLLLYPRDQTSNNPVRVTPFFNVWIHAMPTLLFTLDHMIVAHPSRLMHFVYPFLFSLAYVIFAYVYYLVGGLDPRGRVYIYPMLNFTKPLSVLKTIGLTSVLLVCCSTLQYGLYRLRVFIARKLGKLQ